MPHLVREKVLTPNVPKKVAHRQSVLIVETVTELKIKKHVKYKTQELVDREEITWLYRVVFFMFHIIVFTHRSFQF